MKTVCALGVTVLLGVGALAPATALAQAQQGGTLRFIVPQQGGTLRFAIVNDPRPYPIVAAGGFNTAAIWTSTSMASRCHRSASNPCRHAANRWPAEKPSRLHCPSSSSVM